MKRIILALFLILITGCQTEINSFEECVAAGNPVMESYPERCRDASSGETFVREIEDDWRIDIVSLMQHETEGYYGCFGCNTPSEGPALCIDPTMEMKLVEETADRYCNENFEVVENI